MTQKRGAATAEDQSQTQGQPDSKTDDSKLAEELGKKFAEAFDMKAIKDFIKDVLSEMGFADKEITDDLIHEAFVKLPSDKKDPLLRSLGLVPTPGFFSSVLGWHNVEHMRSRGWRNKVAGLVGILYQAAAIGLATYMGVNWYRNR